MVKIVRKNTSKKKLEEIFSGFPTSKKLDAFQFLGKLKLEEDPVKIQKKLRNEWGSSLR